MQNGSLLDGSEVQWDAARRRPTKVRCDVHLPVADSAEDAVIAFLSQHADELQLPPVEESLAVVHSADLPSGRVLRLQQREAGVPVLDTEVVVEVDNAERVRQVTLAHQPRPEIAQPRTADEAVTADDALRRVLENLGGPKLRGSQPTPSRVYYPTPEGLRLAYLVLLPTQDPPHDWRTVIDAYTGEILEQRDLLLHVDGQGLVFDPNPVVTANDAGLRDPDATAAGCGFAGTSRATIDAQQVTRILRDITFDGTVHRLEGPFVDIHNFGAPATTEPQEAGANNFNYSSGDERFEAVNVYYHTDACQRYLQNGAQGPAITTAHNAQIRCDPHEGGGGAWFSPLDGGLHFGNSGPCRPDRAEDAHVILHEYGHAIQNNQVPGWGAQNPTTGRWEARAMGEGFGDILACVFFAGHGGGFQREIFEQWIFGDVGGLRQVDGTKTYPTDWLAPSGGYLQEHPNGEIWSASLWNIYRAIGGDSMNAAVRQAARDALLKTVVLSHHLLAANASMPDAAEAIMRQNAALDEYLGRHLMQALDSFHARGLLPCDPAADLTITDGTTFWNSPDLWIRNSDDGGTTHQSPEAGQDNWFHARVTNIGSVAARAFVVTFNVKPWAGTEFVYPGDFIPYISAGVGFNLAPGASTVVKAKWPASMVPAAGTHACWLASVYTPTDLTPTGAHVWEHNNLAQKNLTVVDLVPGDSFLLPVQIGNLGSVLAGLYRLEIRRPKEWTSMPVAIVHRNPEVVRRLAQSIEEVAVRPHAVIAQPQPVLRFLEPARVEVAHRGVATDPVRFLLGRDSSIDLGPDAPSAEVAQAGGGVEPIDGLLDRQADLVSDRQENLALAFRPGPLTGFPTVLQPKTPLSVGLKITAPPRAKPGDSLQIDLLQRNTRGQVVGGVTVQVNVIAQ